MNKSIITRNFSRYARFYDQYSDVQSRAAGELLGLMNGDDFKNILEIGCGTGNYTSLLRGKFKAARIKSIDISKEMLEVARTKLKDKEIEFMNGDSEELRLNETFDLITSNACFQWFTDLEEAFKKLRGSLSPCGMISFSIFGPLTLWELNSALKSVLGEVNFAAKNFIAKDRIEKSLKDNFREIEVKEIKYEESFNDLNSLLHKIKYTGVRGQGLADKFSFNRGTLEQVKDIYLDKFGAIKASFQVFFCRGRK